MMGSESNMFCVKSFNCRGIRNKIKRQEIFNWLKTSTKAICFLQETHSYEFDETEWKREFQGEMYFSHGTCNSRGVSILIPDYLPYKVEVKNVKKDTEGRVLLLNCEIEENPIVMINLYAPTKDNTIGQNNFIDNLSSIIEEYSDIPMIIGGDLIYALT